MLWRFALTLFIDINRPEMVDIKDWNQSAMPPQKAFL